MLKVGLHKPPCKLLILLHFFLSLTIFFPNAPTPFIPFTYDSFIDVSRASFYHSKMTDTLPNIHLLSFPLLVLPFHPPHFHPPSLKTLQIHMLSIYPFPLHSQTPSLPQYPTTCHFPPAHDMEKYNRAAHTCTILANTLCITLSYHSHKCRGRPQVGFL